MQNRVYGSRALAKAAPTGMLEILVEDGFCWNSMFDPELIKYDEEYNNAVPSNTFNRYYDEIADYLASKYKIEQGPIIDIGCGKGTFLKRMATRYSIEGIGIDPSYEGPENFGRLRFIKEELKSEHIDSVPSLIICRHTLEHIPNPINFLLLIISCFPKSVEIPIFVEVPDIDWIIRNKSWWDFCYEHVNYFSKETLHRCLTAASCSSVMITRAFGGQYLWAEGVINSCRPQSLVPPSPPSKIEDMSSFVSEAMNRLAVISRDRKLVIWGMATKGVMYAMRAELSGIKIHYAVDINIDKQGKYAPVSGIKISRPEELPANESYSVICMNPNYMEEVRSHLIRLDIDFLLYEP